MSNPPHWLPSEGRDDPGPYSLPPDAGAASVDPAQAYGPATGPVLPPRRAGRWTMIAAGLGVAVVAFGIGFGVSALTHSSTTPSAAPSDAVAAVAAVASSGTTPTTAPTGPPASSGKTGTAKKAAVPHVSGAVVSSSGSTWTITTKAGTRVSVTVDAHTVFGTKKKPATAADFPAGTTVTVQLAKGADPTATTVTALRIVKVGA